MPGTYAGLMIDIDGVVLLGGEAIPQSRKALSKLVACKIPFVFVTNNVTTPRSTLIRVLRDLAGIPSPQIVDPLNVLEALTRSREEWDATWLFIGSEELERRLRDCGFSVVTEPPFKDASAVLVSSVISLEYPVLVEAARLLAKGAEAWTTGLDRIFFWQGLPWPGVGAVASYLEYATGRRLLCLGKPSPEIFLLAQRRLQVQGKILMIGDDLTMDIEAAGNAGFDSALVISGVTRLEDLGDLRFKPKFIASDLAALVEAIVASNRN